MSEIQRGLVPLLQDLDRRARPGPPSKNRPIQRLVSLIDVVGLSSDSVTVTVRTPPFQLGAAANVLIISLGQLR